MADEMRIWTLVALWMHTLINLTLDRICHHFWQNPHGQDMSTFDLIRSQSKA